jgi:hypothetical protein
LRVSDPRKPQRFWLEQLHRIFSDRWRQLARLG